MYFVYFFYYFFFIVNNNKVKETAYQESLRGKCKVWRGEEVESVEKEWEKLRDIVMECVYQ